MADSTQAAERLVMISIDDSDHSRMALNFYIDNIHQAQNKVLLVNVAEPPFVSSQQAMFMSGELWEQMMAAEKEKIKALEEKFADIMREKGVSGKIKAVFGGRPGECIVDMATQEKASLIVMGTRGLGSIRRTVLGSVSDYVVHHAHCPVCVCRH